MTMCNLTPMCRKRLHSGNSVTLAAYGIFIKPVNMRLQGLSLFGLKFALSLAIFMITMILVILRPRNLGIGYSALIGGAASVILGITTIPEIIQVWNIVWNATFTFVAIIIMSLIYDEVGFFEYASMKLAGFSGGSGKKFFVLMILLGAVISAFFANDGAVLVLTPIMYSFLSRSGADRKAYLAFIMAVGFISDTASMPFVISNLVNIITSGYFHIDFLHYTLVMFVPYLVSVAASLGVLYAFYRKSIPSRIGTYRIQGGIIRDRAVFLSAVPVLAVLITLYAVTGLLGIPVAFIAVPAIAVLFVIVAIRGKINTGKILREAPWQIVLFSLGMYIIVYGLGENGLISVISGAIESFSGLWGPLPYIFSGYLFALMASVMNNLPSVMLGNLSIGFAHTGILPYVNVIANDIGPKFTPVGSLATLLWLYTLDRKRGMKISYGYYMKVGFVLALPVLTVTLVSLWAVSLI